jgi:membrane fusion protein (multidrug efflux system)
LAVLDETQNLKPQTRMIKKIFLALLLVALVGGGLAGIKALQIRKMIDQGQAMVMPPAVVSTANATSVSWETVLTAVGSVTAVQGVTLTAETPGKVVRIVFDSGDRVAAATCSCSSTSPRRPPSSAPWKPAKTWPASA